ncbi:membrane-bound lytic murein transglycosylase A precursor [Altererythrobacter sp. B11]|uniref:murein transglycosylase A n=1 Tax=Altererythrobacter sp. B11 TaxID=2060312 RepID=UPI000DC6E359|nr:murein transglycosylase A [Altererythrobacter sp. B11]BBC74443.1 membrane-bound lytic murein transglycosylase A precursor [Altererythrobacter sp. B11]
MHGRVPGQQPGWQGLPRALAVLASLCLIAACGPLVPRIEQPEAPAPSTAREAGVYPGPAIRELRFAPDDARDALASFIESCPRLLRRTDASGLTTGEDWRPACTAAATWPVADAPRFFETWFEAARVGDGRSFVTGYFEPEIAGSRDRRPGFEVPVYGLPGDLVRAWPQSVPEAERTGNPPLGRFDESGNFIPYYTRAEIEDGALAGRGLEIAWVADPVEFFFLQVQGSGRLRTPEGEVIRIGYAGQNGRAYTGIGGVMRERGLIGDGPGQYAGSMQGIMQYIREHPAEGRALMRENESWVFFRVLTGDGPLGALEVPVRPGSSVAADPRFVPLGAPVYLTADRPELDGVWIAQDTGGAIKGPNRFDSFWGAGEDARRIAGGMSGRGTALLLLPKGTLARLGTR